LTKPQAESGLHRCGSLPTPQTDRERSRHLITIKTHAKPFCQVTGKDDRPTLRRMAAGSQAFLRLLSSQAWNR